MTSNRLPILATEIATEHAAARKAGQALVAHAVQAGRHLIEAKELVGHGDWQGWLVANVPGVSIRTAQRYMRAARNAGKNDTVSLFRMRDLIRPQSRTCATFDGDPWKWAEQQLDGPFNAWDFDAGFRWLQVKVARQLKLPAPVAMFLDSSDDHGVEGLRLCRFSDIWTAIDAVLPVAKGEVALPLDLKGMAVGNATAALLALKLVAQGIAGKLFKEVEHPSRGDPERFSSDQGRIRADLVASLDAKLVELEAVKADPDRLLAWGEAEGGRT